MNVLQELRTILNGDKFNLTILEAALTVALIRLRIGAALRGKDHYAEVPPNAWAIEALRGSIRKDAAAKGKVHTLARPRKGCRPAEAVASYQRFARTGSLWGVMTLRSTEREWAATYVTVLRWLYGHGTCPGVEAWARALGKN